MRTEIVVPAGSVIGAGALAASCAFPRLPAACCHPAVSAKANTRMTIADRLSFFIALTSLHSMETRTWLFSLSVAEHRKLMAAIHANPEMAWRRADTVIY